MGGWEVEIMYLQGMPLEEMGGHALMGAISEGLYNRFHLSHTTVFSEHTHGIPTVSHWPLTAERGAYSPSTTSRVGTLALRSSLMVFRAHCCKFSVKHQKTLYQGSKGQQESPYQVLSVAATLVKALWGDVEPACPSAFRNMFRLQWCKEKDLFLPSTQCQGKPLVPDGSMEPKSNFKIKIFDSSLLLSLSVLKPSFFRQISQRFLNLIPVPACRWQNSYHGGPMFL